jgi:hypothetical protein
LTGTPTTAGHYSFTVQVLDSTGAVASQPLTMHVAAAANQPAVAITTTALPPASAGAAYSQTLAAAGGTAPYTWTLAIGTLPVGLALDAVSGVIGGTPTETGTYPLVLAVADSTGATAAASLTLVVNSAEATRQGVFAQVASGAGWTTSLYLVNPGTAAAPVTVNFWADGGTPLTLPLSVEGTGGTQTLSAATVSLTVGAQSTVMISSGTAAGLTGWADVVSSGTVTGYGVFHFTAGVESEGTISLESASATSLLLPFEATNGFVAGLAVANLDANTQAQVSATDWNSAGVSQSNAGITLVAGGHRSMMLAALDPTTTGQFGAMQFSSSTGGALAALAIRVNPAGGLAAAQPLRTVAATNGKTVAGFAQVAVGGGWSTTLYLTNPGTTSVGVQLSYFDDQGAALALPMNVAGNGQAAQPSNASAWKGTIAAGATVKLDMTPTAGQAALTGWAQVVTTTTGGTLAGYGVFHYTSPAGVPSEGAVPMDIGAGSTFVLPFEARNGFAMGIGLANLSTNATTVTITPFDENGVVLTGASVDVGALGHTSFMLGDKFPSAVGTRGYLVFSSGSEASITGLGLRVNPAGGFASAPKL